MKEIIEKLNALEGSTNDYLELVKWVFDNIDITLIGAYAAVSHISGDNVYLNNGGDIEVDTEIFTG
jgi:hypothetical protein